MCESAATKTQSEFNANIRRSLSILAALTDEHFAASYLLLSLPSTNNAQLGATRAHKRGPRQRQNQGRGPYIKDVRKEGGWGVSPKADIVREVVWI